MAKIGHMLANIGHNVAQIGQCWSDNAESWPNLENIDLNSNHVGISSHLGRMSASGATVRHLLGPPHLSRLQEPSTSWSMTMRRPARNPQALALLLPSLARTEVEANFTEVVAFFSHRRGDRVGDAEHPGFTCGRRAHRTDDLCDMRAKRRATVTVEGFQHHPHR